MRTIHNEFLHHFLVLTNNLAVVAAVHKEDSVTVRVSFTDDGVGTDCEVVAPPHGDDTCSSKYREVRSEQIVSTRCPQPDTRGSEAEILNDNRMHGIISTFANRCARGLIVCTVSSPSGDENIHVWGEAWATNPTSLRDRIHRQTDTDNHDNVFDHTPLLPCTR